MVQGKEGGKEKPMLKMAGAFCYEKLSSNILKPWEIYIHIFNHLSLYPQAQFFQLVCKLISTHEVYRWSSVSRCLTDSVPREGAGCDKKPLVSSTDERTAKISDCPS